MGRVARYKKVKSFDPYSKENGGRVQLDNVGIWGLGQVGRKPKKRSKTAEKLRTKRKKLKSADNGFDAPPEKGDDFDVADLIGSLKKEIPPIEQIDLGTRVKDVARIAVKAPTQKLSSILEDEREEKNVTKLLKLDAQVEKKQPAVVVLGRMEGESKAAYRKRVKAETRQIIRRERMDQHNPEKRQKKKDFLNNKKKNKKRKRIAELGRDILEDQFDDDRSSGLVTGERAVAARAAATEVVFGEQAERPPVFRQLPRGASTKTERKVGSRMRDEHVEAEHEAMEKMRRTVQVQYAVIKRRRKDNGDFHL
jgi:hypothetical protein